MADGAQDRSSASSNSLRHCARADRAPDAAKGDGWIIQAATNSETMLTEVNLFDARAIAKGPIATAKLPLRLKSAYHGSWSDGSKIKPSGLV
jgi:carotenoid cleavage dioxygenase